MSLPNLYPLFSAPSALTTGVTAGSTTSSSAGNATVEVLVGSTGATGPAGAAGVAGATGLTGLSGATGAAASIQVGTTSVLSYGVSPTVSNAGTSGAAILNFGLPMGPTGQQGVQGPPGLGVSSGSQLSCVSINAATGVFSTLIAATGYVQTLQSYTNSPTQWTPAPMILQPLGGGSVSLSGQALIAGTGAFSGVVGASAVVAGTGSFNVLYASGSGCSISLGNVSTTASGVSLAYQTPITFSAAASGTGVSISADANNNLKISGNITGTSATFSGGLSLSGNLTGSTASFSGAGSFGSVSSGSGAFSTLTAGTGSLVSLVAGTGSFVYSSHSSLSAATGSITTLIATVMSAATGSFTAGASITQLSATAATISSISAATGTFVNLSATGLSVSGAATAGSLTITSTGTASNVPGTLQVGTLNILSGGALNNTLGTTTLNTLGAQQVTSVLGAFTSVSASTGTFLSLSAATGSFSLVNAMTGSFSNGLSATYLSAGTGTFLSLSAATGSFSLLSASTGTLTSGLATPRVSAPGTGTAAITLSGSTITTQNSITLDDGSGDMVLPYPTGNPAGAARLQVGSTAVFNGNTYALGVASPGSGPYPFGVMINGQTALQVSTFNQVSTLHNVLDNGSGTLSAGTGSFRTVAISSSGTGTSTNVLSAFATAMTGSLASPNFTTVQLGANSGGYNNGTLIFASSGAGLATNSFTMAINGVAAGLTVNGNSAVTTKLSTLDDGTGLLTVGGGAYVKGSASTSAPSGVASLQLGSNYLQTYSASGTGAGTTLSLNNAAGGVSTFHNTLDDGSGNVVVAATGTFKQLQVNNAAVIGTSQYQLSITPGVGGSPNGGTLLSTLNSTGIPQSPLVYYTQQNNTPNFASYLLLTPYPNSTGAYTAATSLGVGGGSNNIGLYCDSRAGVNGVLYLGNGVSSASSTAPTFSSLTANASGSVAFSGGLTTGKNTLDDGSGNLTSKVSLQVNQAGTTTLGLSIQCSPTGAYGFSDAVVGDAVYQAQANTNALFGFVGAGAGQGSQPSLLRLNYANSSVKTKNNTLDDGSGNMSINPTVGGTSKLSLYGSIAAATGYFYGFGAAAGLLQYNSQGGHTWFSQGSATGAQTSLMSLSSTGALTLTGTGFSVSSNTAVPSNATTNTVLAQFNSPLAAGASGLSTSELQLTAAGQYGLYLRGGFQQGSGMLAQLGFVNGVGVDNSPFMSVAPNAAVSFSGAVSSRRNTLDDGSGNLTTSSTSNGGFCASFLQASATGSANTNVAFGRALSTNNSGVLNYIATGSYLAGSATATTVPYAGMSLYGGNNFVYGDGSARCFTVNSTLDDSTGNASFAGTLTAAGNSTGAIQLASAGASGAYFTNSAANDSILLVANATGSLRIGVGTGASQMTVSTSGVAVSALTVGGSLTAAANSTGAIQLASAGVSGAYFTNSAANDSIIRVANATGSLRIGVGTGASQMTVSTSGVSVGSLISSSISNGTTSYVVPTSTDPRALRLAYQPNYYVNAYPNTNGMTLYTSGSPYYILYGGPGLAYSGISTSNASSSITLPVAAVYSVAVTLVGTVAASSTATLTVNSVYQSPVIGGATATAVNQSSTATSMTICYQGWVQATTAGSIISLSTTTNFSGLTSASLVIQQIVAV